MARISEGSSISIAFGPVENWRVPENLQNIGGLMELSLNFESFQDSEIRDPRTPTSIAGIKDCQKRGYVNVYADNILQPILKS